MLRVVVFFFLLFFVLPNPIFAVVNEKPILEVTPRGKVLVNKEVLGASLVRNASDADEDYPASTGPKEETVLGPGDIVQDSEVIEQIDLDKKDGRAQLTTKTATGSAKKHAEKDDLLVKLDGVQKKDDVNIRYNGKRFEIEQNSVKAETDFPLRIDPDANSLSVVTSKGEVLLKVLPDEAISGLLGSNIIDRQNSVEIIENPKKGDENGAFYKVKGQKDAKLFALFTMQFSLEVSVGVQSGEETNIKKPFFFRFFGFLFTK